MTRKTRTAVATLAGLTILTGVTLTQLPDDGPGRVTASAETPPPVEDVVLPAEVATPDVEPTETPQTPPETYRETPQTPEEPTTVPQVPQAVPEPSEADSYTPDCPAILAGPDDGSDLWLDCYSWAVETAETPEEQAQVPDAIHEDDPRWDCRTMGNRTCGVQIEDAWYVVTFDDAGKPLTITERGW